MAWVRIHDAALSHPKLVGLIDWSNPFCVWVWGLSYCQTHLTNGRIPGAALPHAKANKAAARLVLAGLWEALEAGGWQVHDYLHWNDSRELVTQKRTEAKDRMALARERRSMPRSRELLSNRQERTSPEVLRRVGLGKEDPKEETSEIPIFNHARIEPTEIENRAARFVERFAELYSEKRKGAKYLRRQPALDWDRACTLCRTWDDARLEKMAIIFLTTDDEWISQTDRGFAVFVARATWCDERLSEWEARQKARV